MLSSETGAMLSSCLWTTSVIQAVPLSQATSPLPAFESTIRWLRAYFDGAPTVQLPPLDTARLTPWQRRVLDALSQVPYGTTASYSDLARLCGNPAGARAVARALHTNPWHLILPCHRIIHADGRADGYAAGTPLKLSLLRLEHAI